MSFAFLGAQALASNPKVRCRTIAAFSLSMVLRIVSLWPAKNAWTFVHKANVLIDSYFNVEVI